MKYAALLLLVYTLLMLLVHLSTYQLLARWYAPGDSWVKRRLSPLLLLRLEVLYWVLALAAWQLWSRPVKIVVMSFAAVHLAVWLGEEYRAARGAGGLAGPTLRRPVALAITAFDLIEAITLAGLGLLLVAFLFRGA